MQRQHKHQFQFQLQLSATLPKNAIDALALTSRHSHASLSFHLAWTCRQDESRASSWRFARSRCRRLPLLPQSNTKRTLIAPPGWKLAQSSATHCRGCEATAFRWRPERVNGYSRCVGLVRGGQVALRQVPLPPFHQPAAGCDFLDAARGRPTVIGSPSSRATHRLWLPTPVENLPSAMRLHDSSLISLPAESLTTHFGTWTNHSAFKSQQVHVDGVRNTPARGGCTTVFACSTSTRWIPWYHHIS